MNDSYSNSHSSSSTWTQTSLNEIQRIADNHLNSVWSCEVDEYVSTEKLAQLEFLTAELRRKYDLFIHEYRSRNEEYIFNEATRIAEAERNVVAAEGRYHTLWERSARGTKRSQSDISGGSGISDRRSKKHRR